MSEQWTWGYEDASGAALTGEALTETAFPTQSDAESWFGEVWHDLSDAGVAAVTLYRDGEKVYGPMSLDAAP
ncbi:hypothetical protein ACK8HX_02920 [Oryzobacter sp. R7]|uniref:hypothetical protein n=1 Tax=Oryzobacter faecalis TaxID=3388656 RepID=UPI00398D0E68